MPRIHSPLAARSAAGSFVPALAMVVLSALWIPPATAVPVAATPGAAVWLAPLAARPAALPRGTAPRAGAAAGLDARLEKLCLALDARRQQLHVPGAALAVVKGDDVVLARGFGLRDVARKLPVEPDTIFAAGSTTKAFTATLIAMLVDDGVVDWDDPVTKHLPSFDLQVRSEDPAAAATLRDLLCHRTGFPRMGVLWADAGATASLDLILRTASRAEPLAPFRRRFYYNNLTFTAAGLAGARAAGKDWHALIAERILGPLGMTSSSTTIEGAAGDPRWSLGYQWDEDLGEWERKPLRDLEKIAPAGSLNTNVLDMARWVRFQLGRGVFQGKRLVSEEALRETWTGQIAVGGAGSYGLGWFLGDWRGQSVVQHGGNVDGFAAQVGLLPDSHLGYALLMNVTASKLQDESLQMVWEALLGGEDDASGGDVEASSPVPPFEDFTGEYLADFASFDKEVFHVLVKEDRLAVDIPSQRVYPLRSPDERGWWVFELTDTIAVSFERDDEGRVDTMILHQAGFDFELPRLDRDPADELPEEQLERYIAAYHSDEDSLSIRVLLHDGRLAIELPDEGVLDLYPPDEDGEWVARVRPDLAVAFEEAEDGTIEGMSLYRPGAAVDLVRVEGEAPRSVTRLDALIALRHLDRRALALDSLGGIRLTGTVSFPQAGVEGRVTMTAAGTDRYVQVTDLGPFGKGQIAVDGDRGWSDAVGEPFRELHGSGLRRALDGHPARWSGDWRDSHDEVRVVRKDVLGGHEVWIVEVRDEDAEDGPSTLWVDAETGDTRMEVSQVSLLGVGTLAVTTLYDDVREVGGIRIPFRVESSNEQTGRTVLQYTKVETGVTMDPLLLAPPAGAKG